MGIGASHPYCHEVLAVDGLIQGPDVDPALVGDDQVVKEAVEVVAASLVGPGRKEGR